MKNALLIFAIITVSINAHSDIAFNANATSDYVWRGVTQTAHRSAIQGGLEYTMPSNGLLAGVWTSNVEPGSEADLYLKYPFKFTEEFSVTAGGTFYYYTQNNQANTAEANLLFATPFLSFSVNYTGNYFGTNTPSIYFEANRAFLLDKEQDLSIIPTIGYVTFDDKDKAQSTNYLNYRVELLKEFEQFGFRIFHTNTNRKAYVSSVKTDVDDDSIGVGFSKIF